MYLECGYAYYRRYILGEYQPPGIAMLRGTGVHGGAEHNFTQKVESHEDLPWKEIVDFSVHTFDQALVTDGVELNPEERKVGRKKIVAEARDVVQTLAAVHATQQAPKYQPVYVEQWAKIKMPSSKYDLNGKIDLIAEGSKPGKTIVRDFKTASRKKSQGDVDGSLQLHFYAAATAVLTGVFPENVGLDVLIETKTGKQSVQELTTIPTKRDFAALTARINAVIQGIEAGVFLPATPGSWKCSLKWCGYAQTCPYYNSERDPFRD
jgi:hypothetical protein